MYFAHCGIAEKLGVVCGFSGGRWNVQSVFQFIYLSLCIFYNSHSTNEQLQNLAVITSVVITGKWPVLAYHFFKSRWPQSMSHYIQTFMHTLTHGGKPWEWKLSCTVSAIWAFDLLTCTSRQGGWRVIPKGSTTETDGARFWIGNPLITELSTRVFPMKRKTFGICAWVSQ